MYVTYPHCSHDVIIETRPVSVVVKSGIVGSDGPAQHVSLFDEFRNGCMVVQLTASKKEAWIEALHCHLAAMPLAQVHLQMSNAET